MTRFPIFVTLLALALALGAASADMPNGDAPKGVPTAAGAHMPGTLVLPTEALWGLYRQMLSDTMREPATLLPEVTVAVSAPGVDANSLPAASKSGGGRYKCKPYQRPPPPGANGPSRDGGSGSGSSHGNVDQKALYTEAPRPQPTTVAQPPAVNNDLVPPLPPLPWEEIEVVVSDARAAVTAGASAKQQNVVLSFAAKVQKARYDIVAVGPADENCYLGHFNISFAFTTVVTLTRNESNLTSVMVVADVSGVDVVNAAANTMTCANDAVADFEAFRTKVLAEAKSGFAARAVTMAGHLLHRTYTRALPPIVGDIAVVAGTRAVNGATFTDGVRVSLGESWNGFDSTSAGRTLLFSGAPHLVFVTSKASVNTLLASQVDTETVVGLVGVPSFAADDSRLGEARNVLCSAFGAPRDCAFEVRAKVNAAPAIAELTATTVRVDAGETTVTAYIMASGSAPKPFPVATVHGFVVFNLTAANATNASLANLEFVWGDAVKAIGNVLTPLLAPRLVPLGRWAAAVRPRFGGWAADTNTTLARFVIDPVVGTIAVAVPVPAVQAACAARAPDAPIAIPQPVVTVVPVMPPPPFTPTQGAPSQPQATLVQPPPMLQRVFSPVRLVLDQSLDTFDKLVFTASVARAMGLDMADIVVLNVFGGSITVDVGVAGLGKDEAKRKADRLILLATSGALGNGYAVLSGGPSDMSIPDITLDPRERNGFPEAHDDRREGGSHVVVAAGVGAGVGGAALAVIAGVIVYRLRQRRAAVRAALPPCQVHSIKVVSGQNDEEVANPCKAKCLGTPYGDTPTSKQPPSCNDPMCTACGGIVMGVAVGKALPSEAGSVTEERGQMEPEVAPINVTVAVTREPLTFEQLMDAMPPARESD